MPEAPAIATTVAEVAHFLDAKQWGHLRELFASVVRTDDRSLLGGEAQELSGDALVAAWRTRLQPVVTQHLFGPITVKYELTAAVAECHVRAYHFAPGTAGGDEWMVAGHYRFALTRSAEWVIDGVTLAVLYQTGNVKLLERAGGK